MDHLEIMKKIQEHILEYLDDDDDSKPKIEDFLSQISQKTNHDKYEIKSILYTLSAITNNHHRNSFFYTKIKKVISFYKNEIKQTLSNHEIFDIFHKNKLILLLLIDEEIIIPDEFIIARIIETPKYEEYFLTEIQTFHRKKEEIKLPENFEEKRRTGENDYYICSLIRNDSVVDFIIYYNQNSISSKMKIPPSIYETNSFLQKREPSLIEYAAFYGSIEIFNFLRMNNAELTPSLFIYAIHGKNADIIHILEENLVESNDQLFDECLKESIKCHHNNFAFYYQNNFIDNKSTHSNYFKNEIHYGFRYHNFEFIPFEKNEQFCFFYSVEYDYYKLVEYYLNIKGLNVSEVIIYKMSFFYNVILLFVFLMIFQTMQIFL